VTKLLRSYWRIIEFPPDEELWAGR
jgi:hypothetical protein